MAVPPTDATSLTTSNSSSFLALPPEIRNHIYDAVLETEVLDINLGTEAIRMPSLAATCKQVQSELQQFYANEAHEHARDICLHSDDFFNSFANSPNMLSRRLQAMLTDTEVHRTITIRLKLTNQLGKQIDAATALLDLLAQKPWFASVSCVFDIRWAGTDFQTQHFFDLVHGMRPTPRALREQPERRSIDELLDEVVQAFQATRRKKAMGGPVRRSGAAKRRRLF